MSRQDRVNSVLRNNGPMAAIPGQFTNDQQIAASAAAVGAMGAMVKRARAFLAPEAGPEEVASVDMLAEILKKRQSTEPEQARLRGLYRRWDNLYYPGVFTEGGADHWPNQNRVGGRVHISNNVYPAYVDIPATLQATPPNITYFPSGAKQTDRDETALRQQLFWEWWERTDMELELEHMCRIKGLYGDAALKVYYDEVEGHPNFTLLESSENLYIGWGDSNFHRKDWSLYLYGLSPQGVREEFGAEVAMLPDGTGGWFPWVYKGDHADPLLTLDASQFLTQGERARQLTPYERTQVEVLDYWYKKPGANPGDRPEIWNCIYVGNFEAKPPTPHPEYDDIPYIIIPNTKIPGIPNGRSDLFDVEPILREKEERLSEWAQQVHSITAGQMFQLVGAEPPDDIPDNAMPKPGKMANPGAGLEIKAIQPFMPAQDMVSLMKEYESDAVQMTGLNELIFGNVPAQQLGSSKAITALIANFEARINPRRKLLYQGIKDLWKMSAMVWERKDPKVKRIIDGQYRLNIDAPELTPRDALETASMALQLVQGRVWSLERAMNRTGVEDVMSEKEVVRAEQSDAALNPASVQAQAQLMAIFKQLGIQEGPGAQSGIQGAANQAVGSGPGGAPQQYPGGMQAAAAQQQNPGVKGSQSNNAPENSSPTPNSPLGPQPGQPGGPPAPGGPVAGGPGTPPGGIGFQAQGRLIGGKANTSRITSTENF